MRDAIVEALLQDMLRAIAKIERYVKGYNIAQFLADEKTADAVVRNLEIIGEAARRIPPSFKETQPHVPWRQISGMRNRIVHDYLGVDMEIVWHIATISLPDLRAQIQSILDSAS
jgi:uncharacterized protein with HEPN domain